MPDSHCHAAETGPCAFLPVLEAGCPGAALTPVLHGLGSARWVAVNGWAENQLQASLCHGINSSAPVNIAVHFWPQKPSSFKCGNSDHRRWERSRYCGCVVHLHVPASIFYGPNETAQRTFSVVA